MADTYSKLLGLSGAPHPPSDSGKVKPVHAAKPTEKKADVLANQHTSKNVKKPVSPEARKPTGQHINTPVSPASSLEKSLDTSLLTTKEKTKYGTYLTDESIEKISIRAIQLKRDAHQIVQEAVNQYFERLEK